MGEDYVNDNPVKRLVAILTKAVNEEKYIEMPNTMCLNWASALTVYHNFLKTDSDGYFVIDQFIDILNTPIAKRSGIRISVEDAKIWLTEFKHLLYKLEINRF